MKPLKLILLCLFFNLHAIASQDITHYLCNKTGNILLEVFDPAGMHLYNQSKATSLLLYLEEFNKTYFHDTAFIKVTFNAGYFYRSPKSIDTIEYNIEYGKATFGEQCYHEKNEIKNVDAVSLNCSGKRIIHSDVLRLIYYMLSKVSNGADICSLNASTNESIDSILSLNIYPDFQEVLKYRFYRNYFSSEMSSCRVDYFIQLDSFHLYHKEADGVRRFSDYTDYVKDFKSQRQEQVLASFEHIEYTASDDGNNLLVVDSDSTFYWYSLDDSSLKGPFFLPEHYYKLGGAVSINSIDVIDRKTIKLYTYTYEFYAEFFFDTDKHEYSIDSANSKNYIEALTTIAEKEKKEKAHKKYLIDKAMKEKRQKLLVSILVVVLYIPLLIAGYKELRA